ncbi:hypothetical protein [Salibacterium halotolerans]|uniref:Uncharacterized protein n=1 Tax=Salibacterium halotolerans TaxID=1884432 RepID=A0A1I5RGK8_9BACI|nr:hypothetical protein [Salibacterium halotolerans]SFP57663.1 hypothetical protein SAMN05518683_10738 [Salibacterium halotolerans]
MSTPVHQKKRQIQYLQQKMTLMQEMLGEMEADDDLQKDDIERIEKILQDTAVKLRQFKQDWKENEER